MRLVSCSISEIAERRSYSNNLKILKEFSESELKCARVEDWTQKNANSCVSSLKNSIKLYKYDKTISAFTRLGEVYLTKIDVKN